MANYRVEDVEGIGESLGKKLRDVGITDTDSLLAACKTPADRKRLAEKAEIAPKRILSFANMVDLYRVGGVGSEFAELLEAAGVGTVPTLARRNPANLTKSMMEINEAKKLTRRSPTEKEVTRWVEEAKTLPRVLTY